MALQAKDFATLFNSLKEQNVSRESSESRLLVQSFITVHCLQHYRLGLNPLGDEGAQYIAEALHQNSSQSVKDI